MRKILISITIIVIIALTALVAFSRPKIDMGDSSRYSTKKVADPMQLSLASDTGDTFLSAANLARQSRSVPVSSAKGVPESHLNLELLGTAIGSIKDPIAFIKDLESGKQGMFKLGNTVQEAKIIRIVKGEVVLERAGKHEVLRMSKRALAWSGSDAVSSPILSVNGDQVVLSRNGLMNEATDIINTVQSIRIKPYGETGKVTGLIVDNIPQDSIIAAAGIQNKDVVRTVNNQKIDSYQKALQVFAKVKNQKEIKVSVLRDGKLKQLSYRLE